MVYEQNEEILSDFDFPPYSPNKNNSERYQGFEGA